MTDAVKGRDILNQRSTRMEVEAGGKGYTPHVVLRMHAYGYQQAAVRVEEIAEVEKFEKQVLTAIAEFYAMVGK